MENIIKNSEIKELNFEEQVNLTGGGDLVDAVNWVLGFCAGLIGGSPTSPTNVPHYHMHY